MEQPTPEQKENFWAAFKRALESEAITIDQGFKLSDNLDDDNFKLRSIELVHIVHALEQETGQEMMADNGFDRLVTFADLEANLAFHF